MNQPMQFNRPDNSRKTKMWVGLGLLAALLVGGGLFFNRQIKKEDALPSAEDLTAQMEAAAKGPAPVVHVFGGALTASGNSVTAEGVPPGVCVQTGWKLVRKGRLSVNDVMPARVSAAILSKLCSSNPAGATMTWVPE